MSDPDLLYAALDLAATLTVEGGVLVLLALLLKARR